MELPTPLRWWHFDGSEAYFNRQLRLGDSSMQRYTGRPGDVENQRDRVKDLHDERIASSSDSIGGGVTLAARSTDRLGTVVSSLSDTAAEVTWCNGVSGFEAERSMRPVCSPKTTFSSASGSTRQ